MKLNIYKSEGINQLSRNQQLTPGKIFLIGSESVSNSLYFRKASDIKFAHKVINQQLSGILKVIDYLFTPNGWLLLVKFKTKQDILNYYSRLKANKNETNKGLIAEKIISEVIRLAISRIAVFVNKNSKRKGALVNRAFVRFEISSIDSIKKLMGKMKRREIMMCNQRKQFQPSLKQWKSKLLPNIGMCFLSRGKRNEELENKENVIYFRKLKAREFRDGLLYGVDNENEGKVLINSDKMMR